MGRSSTCMCFFNQGSPVLLLLVAFFGATCFTSGVQAGPPSSFYDASETFYNRLDADQDGRLSVDELVAGAKASWNTTLSDENTMRILELLDADGDGAITRSEFMERIGTAVSEGGVGNVWVGCDWDDDACYDDKCSQFDACWFTCSLEDGPCN